MAEPKTWRVKEIARVLDCTRETVLKLLSTGQLPGFKVRRDWRVRDEDLQEFMRKRPATRPDQRSDLSEIDQCITDAGECTRPSEQDQLQREAEGREFYPPTDRE